MQKETGIKNFDWDALELACPKKRKAHIRNKKGLADDLVKEYLKFGVLQKDMQSGDIFRVTGVKPAGGSLLTFELENGAVFTVDMKKEKFFCSLYNIDAEKAGEMPQETADRLAASDIYVEIAKNGQDIVPDLKRGHIFKTEKELFAELENPRTAYVAKILERNPGGFIVDVLGIKAFLPGSMAAANKILDFDKYIGKEVIVMAETYLKDSGTFVMSHKKYINNILPQKIQELDLDKKYEGFVTGTAKYGIFIEFNEIFTGLLHTSKMKKETLEAFHAGAFKPGDKIEFYIQEITPDNKIIMTDIDAETRKKEFSEFIKEIQKDVCKGKIVSLKPFGALVKLSKYTGIIPEKEIKKKKLKLKNGMSVKVTVTSADIEKEKIYLSINENS